jgi:hypothetical protein
MRNWRGIGHRYAPDGLPGQARNVQRPGRKCAMLWVDTFPWIGSAAPPPLFRTPQSPIRISLPIKRPRAWPQAGLARHHPAGAADA